MNLNPNISQPLKTFVFNSILPRHRVHQAYSVAYNTGLNICQSCQRISSLQQWSRVSTRATRIIFVISQEFQGYFNLFPIQ